MRLTEIPRRRLLLDTGALVDLFAILGLPGALKEPGQFRSDRQRTGLQELLQAAQVCATTPHVLAELEGHLRRMKQGDQTESTFRAQSFTVLRSLRCQEETLGFLEPKEDIRNRFGLADSVLLTISKRLQFTLITTDLTLHEIARSQQVPSLSPMEVEMLKSL